MWPLGWGHFWPQGYILNKLGRSPLMLHTTYQGSRTYGFRQEDFFNVFPNINLCTTYDPVGEAIFGPRDIIWTNLLKIYWFMLHTKYQGSTPCGFRQEDFFNVFPNINLCTTYDPVGGAIFGPRDIIWTNLLKIYWFMLHTKYQGFRPCGFRQEDYSWFSPYKPM